MAGPLDFLMANMDDETRRRLTAGSSFMRSAPYSPKPGIDPSSMLSQMPDNGAAGKMDIGSLLRMVAQSAPQPSSIQTPNTAAKADPLQVSNTAAKSDKAIPAGMRAFLEKLPQDREYKGRTAELLAHLAAERASMPQEPAQQAVAEPAGDVSAPMALQMPQPQQPAPQVSQTPQPFVAPTNSLRSHIGDPGDGIRAMMAQRLAARQQQVSPAGDRTAASNLSQPAPQLAQTGTPTSSNGGLFSGLGSLIPSDFGDRLKDTAAAYLMSGGNPRDMMKYGLALRTQRQEKVQQNKTRAAAIKMGIDPDIANNAGMDVLVPMMTEAWKQKQKAPEQFTLSPGEQRFGADGQPLASVPAAPDLTANQKDFKFARDNGYKGSFEDFMRRGTGAMSLDQKAADRARIATEYGLKPGSAEYRNYVLTGNQPRTGNLTATDKAAIFQADDAVQASRNAIEQLKSVLTPDSSGTSLNDRAGSGYFAGTQAFLARNDPTGIFDDKKGQATTELGNVVLNQALGQLKAIFGGNPTEGERAILLDIQASGDKTPAERKIIIERALGLAQKRLDFNLNRSKELRAGTFYQPEDQQQQSGESGDSGQDFSDGAMTQEEFDALPSGAEFVNPADGRRMRKR